MTSPSPSLTRSTLKSDAPCTQWYPFRIMLLGAPGSGKGSLAGRIHTSFGCIPLSTGDLLRDEIQRGTELGTRVAHQIQRGQLVADSIIMDLLSARLSQEDCVTLGFVLDGFPRNAEQVQVLRDWGICFDLIVTLVMRHDLLAERVLGRLVDPVTNKVYHQTSLPSNESIRVRLIRRSDDTPDSVGRRIEIYNEHEKQIQQALVEAHLATVRMTLTVTSISGTEKIFTQVREQLMQMNPFEKQATHSTKESEEIMYADSTGHKNSKL